MHALLRHGAIQSAQLARCKVHRSKVKEGSGGAEVVAANGSECASPTGVLAESDVSQLLRQPLLLRQQLRELLLPVL